MKKIQSYFGTALLLVAGLSVSAGCTENTLPVAEKVTLDITQAELLRGETLQIAARVHPDDVVDPVLEWSSSDESVVMVDGTGQLTAVGAGNAVVTVMCGDVSASCEISVCGDPEVGDYYFSDGTYAAELKPGKTAIGVVFWTGNPARDDEALAKEQPQCVRGLVISLTESVSMWQPGYYLYERTISEWMSENGIGYSPIVSGYEDEDPINLILGYNCTKALEAFNADAANEQWRAVVMDALQEYRETVPAPEKRSSGWYLPSPKELSLMCSGEIGVNLGTMWDTRVEMRDQLNETLGTIEGATLFNVDGFYWSSMESAEQSKCSLMLSFMGGWIGSDLKESAELVCRYVLAF